MRSVLLALVASAVVCVMASRGSGHSSGGVTLPELVRFVAPTAHSPAPDEKITAVVKVSADGTVGEVTINNPAGTPLEGEVIRAVGKWVFRPTMKDGHSIVCTISIPFSFDSQSGDLNVDLGHYIGD